jgi:predicted hydrocarbon binding protein
MDVRTSVITLAEKLYEHGLNIIPLDDRGKPLVRYSFERRSSIEELRQVRDLTRQIAIGLGKGNIFSEIGVETWLTELYAKDLSLLIERGLKEYYLRSVSFQHKGIRILLWISSEAYEILRELDDDRVDDIDLRFRGIVEIPEDEKSFIKSFNFEEGYSLGILSVSTRKEAMELLRKIRGKRKTLKSDTIDLAIRMLRSDESAEDKIKYWKDLVERGYKDDVDPNEFIRIVKRLANNVDEKILVEMINMLADVYKNDDLKKKIDKIKILRGLKDVKDEKIRVLFERVKEYAKEGYREKIVCTLLNLFRKNNISYESGYKLVESFLTLDIEDPEKLFKILDYIYGDDVSIENIDELKKISGLKELIEEILREEGFDKDVIERKVSETLIDVYSTLDIGRIPFSAWIKRKEDNKIVEWVYAGDEGVYFFKRTSEGSVVQIVSNAKIEKVKNVKILGLNLYGLYRVYFRDMYTTGSLDEIISFISKNYGIEYKYKYAVERLIQYMADEEEPLYYSAGPWIVDDKIVFVREAGYTPSWKILNIWKMPDDDIDQELKKKTLETIKRLVEAYKDPSKASLVLSYAVITPLAHYLRKILNIVFHMIIHGREGSGKSLLLDLLKEIFGIDWPEPFPKTDFQTRVLLSLSTLPAIVDEVGEIIQGYKEGKRESVEVIDILHRSSTQELLRVSGGHQYAGYFLAIRVLIGASNKDITLVPWQMDKFVFVKISREEGIDISKAVGYTPRTTDPSIKKGLRYIGKELLKELEKLIPEINNLRNLSRDEIRRELVKLGYKAWTSLYKKYGLEPFPEPSEPETEIEKESVEELYRDVFIAYISKILAGDIKEINSNDIQISSEVVLEDPSNTSVLDKLNRYEIIAINYKDYREVIMKKSLLSKFIQYARKEYGLPEIGIGRLLEILGLKETSRKIAGKTISHLLVFKI